KTGDSVMGSWSDDSIDCAVVITELAKAPLYGRNHRHVIAVRWSVVRVVVAVTTVRVTAPIRVGVISRGCSVTPIGVWPARVVAVIRVTRSAAVVVAGTTVISVTAVVRRRPIVTCAAVLGASVRTGPSIAGSRVIARVGRA